MERLIICGHIKNIQGLGLSQPSQESHHGQLESFSAPGVDAVTCCQDPGRTKALTLASTGNVSEGPSHLQSALWDG